VAAACQALQLAKSTFYLKGSTRKGAIRLERRIKALSLKNPRYGYRLITQLLRNEGWKVNRKRVQRIRRQAGLQVVKKARKTRRLWPPQGERVRATKPNQVWSYDFVHDRLENGILAAVPNTDVNGARDRRVPNTSTVPLLGASSPAATLSSVLLPQPVGPISETTSVS